MSTPNDDPNNIVPLAVAPFLYPGETARRVPGASAYYATDHGRVVSYLYKKARVLKPWLATDGYRQVTLVPDDREPGSRSTWNPSVHRLVLLTFVGPRPVDPADPYAWYDARHLDGNRENNALSNLAWGRRAVNRRDVFRHGHRAGKRPGTGLDHLNVWRLRCRALTEPIGQVAAEVAATYGITPRSVRDAIRGRVWHWVPSPHDPPPLSELAGVLGVTEERAAELLALIRPDNGRRAA